jgi:3-deoxy-7-phosphoheptulonate synthase
MIVSQSTKLMMSYPGMTMMPGTLKIENGNKKESIKFNWRKSKMIVVMKTTMNEEELGNVVSKIKSMGYKPHILHGVERKVIACIGDERGKARLQTIQSMKGVESVMPILKPYKLASKITHPKKSMIKIKGPDKKSTCQIGGKKFAVIAGPCSVENEEQMVETAKAVKKAGAHMIRGGAYKPRTSPYSFQGMEEDGLKILQTASEESGLPFVTEVMNPGDVLLVAKYADVLQVGARNVQNFSLLKTVGKTNRPILLKRGLMTTIEEFLMSAEYIMSEGNEKVILCERGIRTFEKATRNTLDLSAVPVLQKESHLPVIVDPSHATGHWDLVEPMSRAAVASGCDGLMIEVHPNPSEAWSDGGQSLKPETFKDLMKSIKPFIKAMKKTI